jgi:hypothetical protein
MSRLRALRRGLRGLRMGGRGLLPARRCTRGQLACVFLLMILEAPPGFEPGMEVLRRSSRTARGVSG